MSGGTPERRWPVAALVAVCPVPARRRPDPFSTVDVDPLDECQRLARWLGLDVGQVRHAAAVGLSDLQADRWAVRVGYHPASVWGWDAWATAGLDPLRVAHLVPQARQVAAELAAAGRPLRKADVIAELRARGVVLSSGRAIALWQRLQTDLAPRSDGAAA